MSYFEDIRQFHRKFELEYRGLPRTLEPELQEFRSKFMAEELDEYLLAVEEMDTLKKVGEDYTEPMARALDALVDLTYVVLGAAHLHGFDFDEAWRRVQEANMKKVRAKSAEESKRGSTYDVVKPFGWEPPDHTDLVKDHL